MSLMLAHPWLSLAGLGLGLGGWIVGWMWAANPYRRAPHAMRTGSRWSDPDAE